MRGYCEKCEYEVYAPNTRELMAIVAADGGTVLLPEGDIFCPGCENPVKIDKQGGNML